MDDELTHAWDDDTYTALGAAGVDWWHAYHVLNHARPVVRQHLGAVLRVAGQTMDGRWLAVALIEEHDDRYRVVSARWLEPDEQAAVRKMIEGDVS